MMERLRSKKGEYITDLDMEKYLNYVVTTMPLKNPPAFDRQGVAEGGATGENEEFGDETGSSVNFTEYSLRKMESVLPTGFWVISLVGSLTIISYAIVRLDPVLIIGQAGGLISYIRNLFIGRNKKGGK